MRSFRNRTIIAVLASMFLPLAAHAADCPQNPSAIGTSRVITIKPSEYPLVGKTQYAETLRLKDREVVLTFDDGPSAPYTGTVLDILASECVKATFFMLGSNIVDAPDLLRRAYNEGHNIGTHTYDHETLTEISNDQAIATIKKGIDTATEAIGNRQNLAPFFRAPYLEISKPIERHLLSQGLMIWSIDADSDDWNEQDEDVFVEKAIAELEKAKKGILLMHDVQPVTARGLKALLAELKKRHFKIVHVLPSSSPAAAVASPPAQLSKQSAISPSR